ncbi:MAG TPA: hypothetical protein DCG53_06455 [Syntrophus sp. (in: bacteria)]|jgi:ubiquinone/menaquinone biosynthesis C-methylase UbiE|nr:hypothetical protein [Syntrophus sp. (in: bacteria)]
MEKMPEFDKYARGYSGGHEDPLKRLFGKDLDQFIYVKAKWLWHFLSREKALSDRRLRLLDYGCGTGEMLKWLSLFGFPGHMYGADISSDMIKEAERRCNEPPKPFLSCIGETKTNFDGNYFDYVVATCVFHHIEREIRDDVLREIERILVPGGKLIIFEHNPINPMTRLIVKRAVIDRDAILLYPREIKCRFDRVILKLCRLEYLMFFPPNMKPLHRLEKFLSWCPMGAQFAAVGQKMPW